MMGERLEDIRRLRERMGNDSLEPDTARVERKLVKARILGILLADARRASGHSVEEVAELLDLTSAEYEEMESGDSMPSLPQLEVLAYFFNVPVSHFWGGDTLPVKRQESHVRERIPAILSLRDRILGVQLQQLREAAGVSVADLADQTDLDAKRIRDAERGRLSLPLDELEALTQCVQGRLSELVDGHGPVGQQLQAQDDFERFASLPAELRSFVLQPINRSYLDLAVRLSDMEVEKLRGIAEAILEITL